MLSGRLLEQAVDRLHRVLQFKLCTGIPALLKVGSLGGGYNRKKSEQAITIPSTPFNWFFYSIPIWQGNYIREL
jgi:hypothetical protein